MIFTSPKRKRFCKRTKKDCYVVVDLPRRKTYINRGRGIYNHSGDDGKEDPPVPIPNTEVKLFYAESTYGEPLGG